MKFPLLSVLVLTSSSPLFKSSQILDYLNANLGVRPFTQEKNAIINILYEELVFNVSFDENFTNMVLQENLDAISYTTGKVSEGERIIFKGDIVEGKNLVILNSIKSEFESQVWSESNYNWIVFGYIILVALAFLTVIG